MMIWACSNIGMIRYFQYFETLLCFSFLGKVKDVSKVQTLLFSATLPDWVKHVCFYLIISLEISFRLIRYYLYDF